jgi:hypothetical protein
MNDFGGAKVLKGERILFNAVKDEYFKSKMKLKKIKYLIKRSKKLINLTICGFIPIMIVVHNTRGKTEKLFTSVYNYVSQI